MPQHKPLVLVADDETHILHVLSLKLTQAGCEVLTVEDGQAALRLARQHDIDLLITDHQMPLLSGIELARQLAADPATSFIPVMLLTARGYNIRPRRLEGTRIAHILTKPFSPTDLIDNVKRLIHDGVRNTAPPTDIPDMKPQAA